MLSRELPWCSHLGTWGLPAPHPPALRLLCTLGCQDSPPSNIAGMVQVVGSLGRGTYWLSLAWCSTLLKGDHSEGSSPGESGWLPRGHLSRVAPSGHPSPDSHADPPCSTTWDHRIVLYPLRRQPVSAALSATWLCYMLNFARKTSILNLRWLIAVANIERCSSLKDLVRVALPCFPFNLLCNRIFVLLSRIEPWNI